MGGIFWEDIFGRILIGGFLGGFVFTEFFWWNFWGENFREDFYGRNFLGGLLEDFFGRNSTKSYLNIEGIHLFVKILVFCQDFVPKERKEKI